MNGLAKYIKLIALTFICALLYVKSNGQEICNNGKDDDGDGLADINDPDCQCHFTVNGNLLQNASFESYAHCPVSYLYSNESDIATAWKFGTYININEAFYLHNLACAYDSERVMHYMPPALPLPDGTGFISIEKDAYSDLNILEHDMSKSYVGQCLTQPLKAGEDYTLSFYAGRFRSWDNFLGDIFPFTVAVFGNADCNAVPFGKVNVLGNGCPANYPGWVLLGKVDVVSAGQWVQSKVRLNIPFNINVIEIGPDCSILEPIINLPDGTTFLDYHQYYLDDLHLLPTKDFPFEYIQTQIGSTCSDQPVLVAPVIAGASYQWYKDSVAIPGATAGTYQVANITGASYFNVKITTSSKCSISEPYLVAPNMLDAVHIPSDTVFCREDSMLHLAPALTGITYSINGVAADSVTIKDAGTYAIVARNSTGCERSFTTTVGKFNCTGCSTLMPSAFTPNGDGLNDVFRPRFNCAVSSVLFVIYNRWGQKIFESREVGKGWNGLFNANAMPTGTYVYTVQYKTINNISRTARGVVTLIR